MDFHILIVIGCVFLASFFSFLFINKIFRRKTFEEVVAEKRALTANLYAQSKALNAATRKPKKKELKREKKQRQREQLKDTNQENEEDYSDGQSEEQGSVEEDTQTPGLSKQHVEFEPDAEIVNYGEEKQQRRASHSEKENQPVTSGNNNKKGKKDKRNGGNKPAAGILINKNEPVVVKASVEDVPTLNHFEVRAPKDVVELKKQEQKERKEDTNKQQASKREKNGAAVAGGKKEKPTAAALASAIEQAVEVPHIAVKQTQKQQHVGSPKTQLNNANNKTKQQQHAKKQKETLVAKDLVLALDKLAEHQTIGVSALMNVFARAELNRSEIQILIDYLLNKQQDMPASHAEWSDDICQKLKRQLEEKEKLLAEEQEASIGIQAKLRDLRTEVNMERAQMQARIQAYHEKLQSKEQELAALNQELSSANDKLALERQQFQAKLLHEKQVSSPDLRPQLQHLQQDIAHKEKCIAEMSAMLKAEAQQKNEIIQQQAKQLLALEQQRDELETRQNANIFELEQRKQLETENVELRQQSVSLEASNASLAQQLSQANSQAVQQSAVQTEKAQAKCDALNATLAQKEQELQSLMHTLQHTQHAQHAQQQQLSALQTSLTGAQTRAEQLQAKEQQLQNELQEQRDKNNDVRLKNWKLMEALQNAEAASTAKTKTITQNLGQQHTKLVELEKQKAAAANGGENAAVAAAASAASSAKSEQQRIRELCQRLYPDAVKAHANTALNSSFDEWIEQVLVTHITQAQTKSNASSSNKSTQSSSSDSSSSNNHNTYNNISSNNSSSNSNAPSIAASEQEELYIQNQKLRLHNDELKQLVTKTSNTLSDLEQRAREQNEHWREIVRQKEQLIENLQQHASNGEQQVSDI